MKLKFKGNWSPKRLRQISESIAAAAAYIQENGWCKETLRETIYDFGAQPRPSRVCMMGALQETMKYMPASTRYMAYDFVHQALDGVPMQDFNDSQSDARPVINKLLRVASAIEDRAIALEAKQ